MSKVKDQVLTLSARREAIVETAVGVFARYGFARVSMADIAKAVGMSRTALYPFFANKADIFDGVVRHHTATAILKIRQGLDAQETLGDKLRLACEHTMVHGYEFVHAMPDATDLFEMNVPAVHEIYLEIEALLKDIMTPYAVNGESDMALLARASTSAFRSFKQIAKDSSDLRKLIDMQIYIIGKGLGISS